MKVNVSVQLDRAKIDQLCKAIDISGEQAAEAVNSQIVSDQVVPKNTGELERSGHPEKTNRGKYAVVFDTPYARRLYWHPEYNFRADKNTNAQGKWMQAYIDGDKKDFFKNAFKIRLKANAKGLIK